MRLIINADDLGFSPQVNDAVFGLMDEARISSATIMANAPLCEDAMRRVVSYGRFSFGVHLNVTEFDSLTGAPALFEAGITDVRGRFTGKVREAKPTLATIRAVRDEWSLQIMRLLGGGVPLSHIDGHHHVHTIPWLFGALQSVLRRHGIHRVRASLNCCFPDDYAHSTPRLIAKHAWNWAVRHVGMTRTADYFTDLTWFVSHMKRGSAPRKGVIELMCHPGSDFMPGEADLLASDWRRELAVPIDLISYSEL